MDSAQSDRDDVPWPVYVGNCSHIVREVLNMAGTEKGQERAIGQADRLRLQDIDVHAGLALSPSPLGSMPIEIGTPTD